MKKHRFILFGIVLFVAISAPCFCDEKMQLLNKYDFNDGGFKIVGALYDIPNHPIQKKLGDFYIEDKNVLNDLKRDWYTKSPSPYFACGYHYAILIMKDGRELESLLINLGDDCSTVVTDSHSYYFDSSHIENLIGKAKPATREKKHFDGLDVAREYYRSLSKNDKYLYSSPPIWNEFDGEFKFEVDCYKKYYVDITLEECEKNLAVDIKKNFSNELFLLERYSYSTGTDILKIIKRFKGSKKQYNKFYLFKIQSEWQEFKPSLLILWKG